MNNDMKTDQRDPKGFENVRKLCIGLILVFCFIILATTIVFLALPKKEMSESENRMLAQRPIFTLSSLADGSFMKNFETWMSDQFPFRDKIIGFKTTADRITGKKEANGVYIGKNGFLFEKQTKYEEMQVSLITKQINKFAKSNKGIKTAALLSPNSSYILKDMLPLGAKQESQGDQLKKIKKKLPDVSWVRIEKAFENVKDKSTLFYRTDHHWTTRAAYCAFVQLLKTWKISSNKQQYKFYTVSSDFQGTLASTSGVNSSKDKIEICVPYNSSNSYTVYYESSGEKKVSLFESEKLKQKNQYEVFLGGNFDKVIISTTADTSRTLLIFKDSYANCLIPMLTPYFSKIVIIDPRYFSSELSDVMQEYEFTHALFLYNMNTFLADTSLVDVLAG